MYAQSSMRVEKGFAAMGHELDGDITPIETGLDMMSSKTKSFIGSETLAERRKTGKRSLMTLIVDDETAVPIGHEPIYSNEKIIGYTTTAVFGYRVGKPIALAHVHMESADGKVVELDIAGIRYAARLQYAPAFDPSGNRMKTAI